MSKIFRVYIAGALSTLPSGISDNRTPSKVVADYIANVSDMCASARSVQNLGVAVYVPALDLLLGIWDGQMVEGEYRDNSSAFLEVCDAVYVGSVSKGVDVEIAQAEKLGIPVFRDLDKLWEAIGG